jgi:hypothetical protein
MGKHTPSTSHHSNTRIGGSDRGKVLSDAEADRAERIARDSFAVDVPNRPSSNKR